MLEGLNGIGRDLMEVIDKQYIIKFCYSLTLIILIQLNSLLIL